MSRIIPFLRPFLRRSLRRTLTAVVATAGAAAASGAEPVQAQQTFTACLVPSVGVIYMIKQPGLPTTCLGEGHEEFSWTETSGGQAELEAHKTSSDHDARYAPRTELSASGTLNQSGNPVDWTQLKNVPADFADGVDHTGGTPTDIDCLGCVGPGDLATDAVTSNAILNNSILGADIADGSITGADVANSTITTDDIANGTITGADIAAATLTATHLGSGSVGSSEIAASAVGAEELAFNAVTLEWEAVDGAGVSMVNGANATRTVSCSSGWRVVAGGWDYTGNTPTNDHLYVHESYAQDSDTWFFRFHSGTNAAYTIVPSVTCIRLVM